MSAYGEPSTIGGLHDPRSQINLERPPIPRRNSVYRNSSVNIIRGFLIGSALGVVFYALVILLARWLA